MGRVALGVDTDPALLDTLIEAVIVEDASGELLVRNAAAARLFGEDSGVPTTGWTSPGDGAVVDNLDLPTSRARADCQEVLRVELVWTPGGADPHVLEVSAHPLAQGRREPPYATVTTILDVTERPRRELDLRTTNGPLSQGDLNAVAGHELRTPITTIVGGLDTLVLRWDALSDEDRRQLAEVAQRAARRLRTVADALLAMAEAGSVNLGALPSTVAAAPLLAEAMAALSVDQVTVDCPSDLMVWVTPSHLSQMVTNLVTNALRHGAPPFAVCAEPAGAEVRISVTDAGAGVHGLLVERMFERYVRGAADGQSAGLGLAIVRALAEANDGSVRYEAGDPVGSRFVLTLPAPPC